MSAATAKAQPRKHVKKPSDEMQDELHDAANQAGRKVRDMLDSASEELSDAGDKVSREIHTNPVQSSLIALGVGVVLGALLRR
ncbi:MAG: hypothetical protein ABL951_04765 [Alphaproteobacteria bacterium]